MPINAEAAKIEEALWQCVGQLRWRRPKGHDDSEMVLEQLWERVTGERAWHRVPTLLED